MSLAEEASRLMRQTGVPCGVAALDADVRAELEEALALRDDNGNRKLTAAALSRALWQRGIELTGGVITRHLRQDCACR